MSTVHIPTKDKNGKLFAAEIAALDDRENQFNIFSTLILLLMVTTVCCALLVPDHIGIVALAVMAVVVLMLSYVLLSHNYTAKNTDAHRFALQSVESRAKAEGLLHPEETLNLNGERLGKAVHEIMKSGTCGVSVFYDGTPKYDEHKRSLLLRINDGHLEARRSVSWVEVELNSTEAEEYRTKSKAELEAKKSEATDAIKSADSPIEQTDNLEN